jgi:hypothetical protein
MEKFFTNSFRYLHVWAGVDSVWEQNKLEARKMLVNRADSPAFSVHAVLGVFVAPDSIPERKAILFIFVLKALLMKTLAGLCVLLDLLHKTTDISIN